jgi:hypothetical protein
VLGRFAGQVDRFGRHDTSTDERLRINSWLLLQTALTAPERLCRS